MRPSTAPDRIPLLRSSDEEMVADSLNQLIQKRGEGASLRHVRDNDRAEGYSPDFWEDLVDGGFAAALVPEAEGGSQIGLAGAVVIAEQLGRGMIATPFAEGIAASVAANGVASLHGQVYRSVLAGDGRIALAVDEKSFHDPLRPACRAEQRPDGTFILTGSKSFVMFGSSASALIVSALIEDRVGLLLVDSKAAGVRVEPFRLMDGTIAASVAMNGIRLTASSLIGYETVLDTSLTAIRLVTSAELLGLASAVFERTIDYLKVRRQFGRVIGEFQALQHRAAQMLVELELTRALLMAAARAFDTGSDQAALLAAASKAQAGATSLCVIQEGIQMHGGIGMTDELDLGLYLKRARVLDQYAGDTRHHRYRIAELNGY
jgi:acyl-CoA dehydrogenase